MRLQIASRLWLTAGIAVCACVAAAPVQAQSYPTRTVRFVVPQTPGGATDVFARKFAQALSERWNQTVVVENRPGAAGVLGTESVAKAPNDGYTLLVTYAGSQAINPALYPKIPFDSVKDFETIGTLAVTPFIMIANQNVAARDLREFVALARAKPGELTFASAGNGSVNHLVGEMLMMQGGLKLLHVPYKGVSQAITDVIGGQVHTAFSSVPSVIGIIKSGQVRPLAITSAKRNAVAPDLPSIAESGFPGFDVNPWWGILAPAGTDKAIVRAINADLADILKRQDIKDFLATQGAEPLISSPEEFRRLLEADIEAWAKVVKAAGVTMN